MSKTISKEKDYKKRKYVEICNEYKPKNRISLSKKEFRELILNTISKTKTEKIF